MSRLHPQNPLGVWLICGVAIWLATFVSVRARAPLAQAVVPTQAAAPAQVPAPAPAQVPVPKPPAPGPATFVGDKVCIDCHDEWQRGVVGSPHSRGVDPRSPAATHGCETCHGEGSKHSDDPTIPIKIFAKMLPREINATCATCHNRGRARALGRAASTTRAAVGCIDVPQRARAESAERSSRRRPSRRCAPRATATRSRSSIAPATCRCAKARWSARRATTRTARPT